MTPQAVRGLAQVVRLPGTGVAVVRGRTKVLAPETCSVESGTKCGSGTNDSDLKAKLEPPRTGTNPGLLGARTSFGAARHR